MEFPMLDVSLVVNGVSLMALVFGLVEFLKTLLEWEGKKVTILSAVIAFAFAMLFQAISYIPEGVRLWVEFAIYGLSVGMAASGYYKFVTRNDQDEGVG